jgi:hypothetical protein
VLDEHIAHRPPEQEEQVPTVLSLKTPSAEQSGIRSVDQRGGSKLTGCAMAELAARDLLQLAVHDLEQAIERCASPVPRLMKKARNGPRRKAIVATLVHDPMLCEAIRKMRFARARTYPACG